MIRLIFISVFFAASLQGFSQKDQTLTLTTVSLSDLTFFAEPAENWKIVGEPKAGVADTYPRFSKGGGYLFNQADTKIKNGANPNLLSKIEHGDMFLSLDFLMPKGSNSGIYLQGRYEIQLFDSWGVKVPKAVDCGSIYERWDENRPEGQKGYDGHPAPVNACLAPNLWQHLEIEFRAPRFDTQGKKIEPARFVRVVMNGVVMHENVFLSGPTRASAFNDEKPTGPLIIQGDHGPVLIRNIQYALLNDFKVDVTSLSYDYYEGKFNNDFSKVTTENLIRSGKASAIDVKLADDPHNMCLVFKGTINITDPSLYHFTLIRYGAAKLAVDGEEIIPQGDWFSNQTASKNLDVGEHSFNVSYVKNFSWALSGIGLLISKPNTRPMPLHASTSLPQVAPTPLIDVSVADEPELVRSFMNHNGKKKTHVISVGDPSNIHFSYDLHQASVLMAWKGEFLNTTDMWFERGEPQTTSPLGAPINLSGRCPVAEDNKQNFPDTLDYHKELLYKGYTLNSKRQPQFVYKYQNIEFKDLIEPDVQRNGLRRTISFSSIPKDRRFVIRLAQDKRILKISDNLFVIGDQKFYLEIPASVKGKAEIRQMNDNMELLMSVSGSMPQISYNLLW